MPERCPLCDQSFETVKKVWYTGTDCVCEGCAAIIINSAMTMREAHKHSEEVKLLLGLVKPELKAEPYGKSNNEQA